MIYADLVTLQAAQSALSDLSAAQLADLPAVITAVSQHISARYKRGMAATTVYDVHEIAMNRTLRPRFRPVIQYLRIDTDLVPWLTITNASTATEAMVTMNVQGEADALTATGITLTSTSFGVSATPIVLAWSTYPMVSQLVAAINAAGSGWAAQWTPNASSQPNLGAMPTAQISPNQGGKSALGSGCQLWGYTRVLNDWTVNARGEVIIMEWRTQGYSYPAQIWGVDPRNNRFKVTYQAGNLAVPADVQRAAILTIRDILDRTAHEGGVQSIRSEDYSLVMDTVGGIPSAAKSLLSRYQDRGL